MIYGTSHVRKYKEKDFSRFQFEKCDFPLRYVAMKKASFIVCRMIKGMMQKLISYHCDWYKIELVLGARVTVARNRRQMARTENMWQIFQGDGSSSFWILSFFCLSPLWFSLKEVHSIDITEIFSFSIVLCKIVFESIWLV